MYTSKKLGFLRRRRRFGATSAGLAILALAAIAPAASAQGGTWTKITTNPAGGNGFAELLTDGTVLIQAGDLHNWSKLTPDAQGNYADGAYTQLTPSHIGRLYAPSAVLRDGRFFIAGGEDLGTNDPNDHNTMEIYDPVTNLWTMGPDGLFGDIGDTGFQELADGRMLVSYRFGETCQIYDPTTNAWTQVASKVSGHTGDEESFTLLPDNSVLNSEPNPGEKYIPSLNEWLSLPTTLVTLEDISNDETGPELMLYNGKAFCEGFNAIALYAPGTSATAPGSWSLGPVLPTGQYGGDTEASIEPSGKVLMETGAGFASTASFSEYDPIANTITPIAGPPLTPDRSDLVRMLPLPNGQILVTGIYVGTADSYVYTPVGGPQTSWRPTISSIVHNADGTYTLSGTQLNGLSVGAAYGDDCGMESNYPLVRLVDPTGAVSYARTFNHSTMGIATGLALVSTNFVLPSRLANGTYSVYVVANGISAMASTLTINRLPAPTGLTATPGNAQVALSWSAVSGATSYDIYRGTVPNGESLTYYATSTSTPYTDVRATNGDTFYYKIAALNANGPSAQSAEVNGTPELPCAPAWSSTAVYVAGNQASVSGVNYQANFWTQGQNPTTNNGGPGTGQPWTAVDACGTDTACVVAPAAPTGLTSSNTTMTSTTLSWTASTTVPNCAVTSYTVYQNGAAVATGIGGTTANIVNLTAGTTYSFTVSATDSFGASAQSAPISVTTVAQTCLAVPATPTGLKVTSLSSAGVTVQWNPVTVPTGCTLINYYVSDGGRATGANPATPTYTFSGLAPGTYTISIWAADQIGQSSTPATVSVTIPAACSAVPAAPTGLAASATTGTGTTLNWAAVSVPTGCSITGYTVLENGTSIGSTTSTTFAVTGLLSHTSYQFTVEATDSDGTSSASSAITVITSGIGSVCNGIPAWSSAGVSYAVGALVTYNGSEYKCLQAHTSQPGWDPVDVPALWSKVGSC